MMSPGDEQTGPPGGAALGDSNKRWESNSAGTAIRKINIRRRAASCVWRRNPENK
jgi:hypothetical protein